MKYERMEGGRERWRLNADTNQNPDPHTRRSVEADNKRKLFILSPGH